MRGEATGASCRGHRQRAGRWRRDAASVGDHGEQGRTYFAGARVAIFGRMGEQPGDHRSQRRTTRQDLRHAQVSVGADEVGGWATRHSVQQRGAEPVEVAGRAGLAHILLEGHVAEGADDRRAALLAVITLGFAPIYNYVVYLRRRARLERFLAAGTPAAGRVLRTELESDWRCAAASTRCSRRSRADGSPATRSRSCTSSGSNTTAWWSAPAEAPVHAGAGGLLGRRIVKVVVPPCERASSVPPCESTICRAI